MKTRESVELHKSNIKIQQLNPNRTWVDNLAACPSTHPPYLRARRDPRTARTAVCRRQTASLQVRAKEGLLGDIWKEQPPASLGALVLVGYGQQPDAPSRSTLVKLFPAYASSKGNKLNFGEVSPFHTLGEAIE